MAKVARFVIGAEDDGSKLFDRVGVYDLLIDPFCRASYRGDQLLIYLSIGGLKKIIWHASREARRESPFWICHPVASLLEDGALVTFHNLIGYFFATPGRQAVQEKSHPFACWTSVFR